MATICGFPQPQAEDQAWPLGLVPSRTQRDSQGGQASTFPFCEAPGRGIGRGLAQSSSSSLRASPRQPGPCPEAPQRLLFGAKNLREGSTGGCPGHRHSGSQRKDTDRGVSLQSTSGPWRHCSPARKPSDLPPACLHPHLSVVYDRTARWACWVLSPGQLL